MEAEGVGETCTKEEQLVILLDFFVKSARLFILMLSASH